MAPRSFLLCLALAVAGVRVSEASPPTTCNHESHHSHLVIPLASDQASCEKSGARFLLSHGATFFCPHTYDVKVLATINEVSQQQILCEGYFSALSAGQSPMFALRPTLAENGLISAGLGLNPTWTSPVIYHVWNFGTNSSAGPDEGWKTTTINTQNVSVSFEPVYFQQFTLVTPQPTSLSYLVYELPSSGASPGPTRIVLSHYITNAPDFDHVLLVSSVALPKGTPPLTQVPLLVTFDGTPNAFKSRISTGGHTATLHTNDPDTHLPVTVTIQLEIEREIYAGVDDGFADFGYNCPFPLPYPQSPTLCN